METDRIMAEETINPFEYKPKSKMMFGNMVIYQTKKFNWLNRIMFKAFFGITITNIKEGSKWD